MAWIDNRWIDDAERAELLDVYKNYIDTVEATYGTIEAIEAAGLLTEYYDRLRIYNRLERVHRCSRDNMEFTLEYFSEARNPNNVGNWEGFDLAHKEEAAAFHLEMNAIIDDICNDTRNAKYAIAAPRSHAKSSYFTKSMPIAEIVFRRRSYIIIISETPTVAKANMEWIRNQLKHNAKLREDFGALLSPKDQANITDNGEEFIAWHNEPGSDVKKQIALVQAASTGQALRGRNWNGARPGLIIMDDLEDARPGGNASTPEQRIKLRDWFSQTVMSLGDPRGATTAYVVVGTTVHINSLLVHILNERADFKTRIYRAIIEQPKRADLWEQCRLIYTNRNIKNRGDKAYAFYQDHKTEMDEGARVLWEAAQPLWKLFTWKWDNGSKAFNTEYQNNPIDEDGQVFNPDEFTYYSGEIDTSEARYDVALAVDMALGKSRTKGDYSAVVTVARDKKSGTIYVVDAYGERIKPGELIDVTCKKVMNYEPHAVGVEAVAAQEFFADELTKALARQGYPTATRVRKIYSRTRKELRIEGMLPQIENGTIKFNKKHALLLEQFERYGMGEHDDLIDALEMAISCLTSQQTTVNMVRRLNRW